MSRPQVSRSLVPLAATLTTTTSNKWRLKRIKRVASAQAGLARKCDSLAKPSLALGVRMQIDERARNHETQTGHRHTDDRYKGWPQFRPSRLATGRVARSHLIVTPSCWRAGSAALPLGHQASEIVSREERQRGRARALTVKCSLSISRVISNLQLDHSAGRSVLPPAPRLIGQHTASPVCRLKADISTC